jgi:CHAD domain-containing protein
MPPVMLEARLPVGEAFQKVVDAALANLALNAALIHEPGIESVHQMRIAVRRLRSACKLFETMLEHRPNAARLQDELRWLGRLLGRVRDWDVLLTESLERVAPAAVEDGARREAVRRRAKDRAKVERALASRRYARLVEDMEELALNVAANPGTKAKLANKAQGLLHRLDRRVCKAGRGLRSHTLEERHDLRKKLKKLHYGVGFLAPLYPRKSVKRFRKRTTALQDDLGDLNDLATAERLLREMHQNERPEVGAAMATQSKKLRGPWRRFRKAERFWN